MKTPWQKYRAVEGFKWWTRTIRTISQREQVFIQEGVCFTVCSSGTSGPPYMKNSMKMSSFERYRISIHFFLIEKFTSFFKRKWGNRLIRECEAVPFFSRTKNIYPLNTKETWDYLWWVTSHLRGTRTISRFVLKKIHWGPKHNRSRSDAIVINMNFNSYSSLVII